MGDQLHRRIQALLLKVEATPGVDPTPTGSANALGLAGPFDLNRNADMQDSDEITGTLDHAEFHIGRVTADLAFPLHLKGAGTAGNAPQIGLPLRVCGFAETLNAAAVPTSSTTTATGGTANTFTVDTSTDTDWSTTDGEYEGMPVLLAGNPATPVMTIITRYTVASGVATVEVAHTFGTALSDQTTAVVQLCAVYSPASASIPHATAYGYEDGTRDRVHGLSGNFSLQATVGQPGRIDFTMMGRAVAQDDQPVPATTVEATRPPVWKGGVSLLAGKAAGVNSLTLSPNNSVVFPDDPNGAEGYDVPCIVPPRRLQGQVDPNRMLVATQPVVASFLNGTTGVIHAQAGATAGNRWAVTVRRGKYRGAQSGERSGISIHSIPYDALGSDDETWITFF